ncbi:MAG: ion transporter, partial [Shewanella sp.]
MSATLQGVPTGLQARVINLVEQNWFSRFILTLILINAVLLGMETSSNLMAQYGTLLMNLDKLLLSVFVLELLLRIYAYRGAFFKDAWSMFDLAVIAIALIPASGPLAVLRSLRVLRVLRVLTIVPSMKRVVSALLGSLPGLASIATVLL